MQKARDYYPECPESLIVNLARNGDREAFEELVRRRQSSVRNLMRRFCNDDALADDLAQQVFLKAWLSIRGLREAAAFGGWLKKVAVSIWLQHLRKKDSLSNADKLDEIETEKLESTTLNIDLNEALATLPEHVRLCIVLSYQEGFTNQEIADASKIPLGTVKSHIRRGSKKLKQLLTAYRENSK